MTHLHIMKKKTFLYFLEENFLFYYPAKKKYGLGLTPPPVWKNIVFLLSCLTLPLEIC